MKLVYRSLARAVVAVLLLLGFASAYGQQRLVTGQVTDDSGNAMPGVNVIRKGTSTGTATDGSGRFSIEASDDDVLVISFIGYISQEIRVGTQSNISVALSEDVSTLNEVVVVGYGEMRRADLTTAQTSISSADIGRTVNTTLEQAIQGRSAGVYVTQNTGAPGGGISVNIRGINSINGSNEPLYVIDGVQIQGSISASGTNPLASLNPSDIASMEILQGPSATAIYGSRGTNGVVLITTKRGKAGDIKISYDYSYSLQAPPDNIPVMNLRQYAQMENEYKAIAGGEVREDFLDPTILGEGTNWQDELFKSAAMQKHQVSVSGGGDKTTFYFSGERMLQDGVALGSGFERTSVRVNLDVKPRDWFFIGGNVNYAKTDETLAANNLNGNNLIVNAIQLGPQIPVRNLDGTYGGGNPANNAEQFAPPNPVGIAEISTNELRRDRILGGLNAGVRILDGLELRTNFNTDIGFYHSTYYLPTYNFGWQQNSNAYLENNHNLNTYWGWSQTIQYTKQLGRHHINAMATHEAQESSWKNLRANRSGFLTNGVLDLNAGDAATSGNGGGQGEWAMESYLGRINYNFDDRYIITAAYRADGSANFGPGRKWGYFPSISGVWRVSEESFFNVPFISDLRLRFETGLTGNQGNGGAIYGTLADALPTEWGSGFRPANYPNSDYQWEETKMDNFAITLGLFNGRIQLDADYYMKEVDNLILQSELPWYMGTRGDASVGAPVVNVGTMENEGWTVALHTVNIDKNGFKWESDFNISGFKTKVTNLTTGSSHLTREGPDWFLANFAQRTQVGYAPWLFFGYIEEGLFQSVEEIENSARPVDNNGDPRPAAENSIWVGDVKYRDMNNDNKITADDRTFLGNPYPKWFGGFTNTFSFKGIDVSILLTYSYGNQVYNYVRYQNNNPNNINLGRNMFIEAFDYAKVAVDGEGNPYLLNPETRVNRISGSNVNGNYDRITNKYLEDGSYLRVKNISVNYTLPQKLLGNQNVVRNVRVGASVQNAFTITGYSGYDPEIGSYVGPNPQVAQGFIGVDYGRYPLTPVYSFNIGVDF
ncbi:MAG: TonB-dependent receptor [Cyclobacteriaceae bacterium]|jgi:TonB-linked SusC/RagA family outer membrane protein|nr:TonB-dependent receptor [Cyclobacteriaceae bacterium]